MENFPTIHHSEEFPPNIDNADILEVKERILNLYTKLKAKFKNLYSHHFDTTTTQEIESLEEETRSIVENVYQKIGDQLGSNEGGWYENSETQERFYIKFYKNPDQARIEYIANAIYKKIGIKAVILSKMLMVICIALIMAVL